MKANSRPPAAGASISRRLFQCEKIANYVFFIPLLLVIGSGVAQSEPNVEARLKSNAAWTGEPVRMQVTLYSPGPFSGTASFDLPDLPRTAIMQTGRPVVGTKNIGGTTYFTQDHEFRIYTQLSGEVVIPAIPVRYAGKKSFVSEAEPLEGITKELRFRSNQPPGSENLGFVISAEQVEITQTWHPDASGPMQPGDVIRRTITRRAAGTTAMMFPPIKSNELHGVRSYSDSPILRDSSERGQSIAERKDTLKYQFGQDGTFEISPASFVWWDTATEQLRRETLAGQTVVVKAEQVVATKPEPGKLRWMPVAFAIATILLAGLLRDSAKRLIHDCQNVFNSPEKQAARQLRHACRNGDASTALRAWSDWQKVASRQTLCHKGLAATSPELEHELAALSRYLYGPAATPQGATHWSGTKLYSAFAQTRKSILHQRFAAQTTPSIPKLNP